LALPPPYLHRRAPLPLVKDEIDSEMEERTGGGGRPWGGREGEGSESAERTANQLQISGAEREIKQARAQGGRREEGVEGEEEVMRRSDAEDWQCFQRGLTTR